MNGLVLFGLICLVAGLICLCIEAMEYGMSSIEIEKGIPAPPSSGKSGRRSMYPFRQMEVGDSFVFPRPFERGSENRVQSYASNLASGYAKRIGGGVRFTTGFSEKDGQRVIRVWRVA